MADIRYVIEADSTGAVKSIQKLDKEIGNMPDTTQKAQTGFKNMWGKLALGAATITGIITSLRGLTKWMGNAIDKAAIQEEAEVALRTALGSTGREVQRNMEHYKKYASSIQKATTYGDEEILQVQTLLLQLTNLRRDGIDKATKAIVGMATVYNQDLSAASQTVAKALTGQYGALSRYGIKVEETMSDEEKRASILKQLNVMYSQAEAKTETYAGKVDQLKNAYDDAKEAIGRAITENEEILELIDDVKNKITEFVESGALEEKVNKTTLYFSALAEATRKGGDALAWLPEQVWKSYGALADFLNIQQQAKTAGENYILTEDGLIKKSEAMAKGFTWVKGKLVKVKEETEGAKPPTDALAQSLRKIAEIKYDFTPLITPLEMLQNEVEKYHEMLDMTDIKMEDFGGTGEDVLQGVLANLQEVVPAGQEHMALLLNSWTVQWAKFSDSAQTVLKNIGLYGGTIASGLDSIWSQQATNQNIRIDNEQKKRQSAIDQWYEQQKKKIMANVTDEEERAQKLEELEEERRSKETQLEEEMERKRTAAKREQARRDKQVALMQAIVNTASSIAEALPNLVLAGISAAMGAAQIATISAQPIPLATGGILDRPTFLAGEAGREAVIPLESYRGREIIKEVFRETNEPINLHVNLKAYFGQTELTKFITKTVETEARLGRLKIHPKAIQ